MACSFAVEDLHLLPKHQLAWRTPSVLQSGVNGEGYGVVFRDAVTRRFEQVISIAVVLAIMAAYGWLLWQKWLVLVPL